jgi:hypothetical protein
MPLIIYVKDFEEAQELARLFPGRKARLVVGRGREEVLVTESTGGGPGSVASIGITEAQPMGGA